MNRKDKIGFICGLLILSGIFGWIYEVLFYFFNGGMKEFYLRGCTFLPMIDIYVLGGLLIYLICYRFKNKPYKVFLLSGLICGLLEFIAGLLIYLIFDGKRAWNYNTEILNFGNIYGFICLRSVLFFAISGLILIYILVPLVKMLVSKVKYKNIFIWLFIVIFSLFILDETYNQIARIESLNLPRAYDVYTSIGFKYWK